MLKTSKLISFLEYALCTMLILSCRTVFVHNVNSNITDLINVLIIGILTVLILIRSNLKLNIKRIAYILLLMSYFFIFIIFDVRSHYISFVKIFLVILPLFLLYFSLLGKTKVKDFFKKYANIVYILAICSLFFYLIGSCLHFINTNMSLIMEWGVIKKINGYYFLHFDTQSTVFFGKTILRNTGIFVEGPQYALQLICAYVFTLFDNKKIINRLSVIYFVTLCSTLSITGIVIFIVVTFYKYLKKNNNKIKVIFIPVILIVCIFVTFNLIIDKSETNSYKIREDDMRVAMISLKNNPLFGDGYMNNDIAVSNMSDFRSYNTGLSSAFIIVLIHGGIYLSIIYLAPMIVITLKSHKYKNYFVFVIGILQILLYLTTGFQYTNFMMMLIAFDLDYILKIENGEKNEKI